MVRYLFRIEKGQEGFWAYSEDLDGVTTYADGFDEIEGNVKEAINLYFDGEDDAPKEYKVDLYLDMEKFFKQYAFFNVSALGKAIGENPSVMRMYAKGIRKPSLKKTKQILKGINMLATKISSEV